MTQTERRRFLLSRLLAEAPEYRQLAVPDDAAGQKQLLRALLNVRPPRDASPEFLQVQDEYLRAELAPHCPHCGKLLTMNLRCDDSFVEDAGWHAAAERYSEFLRRHEGQKILFLELGVGGNTPVIIKYPFWRMTARNPNATYVCINKGEAVCPNEIAKQSLLFDGDIAAVLAQMIREHGFIVSDS